MEKRFHRYNWSIETQIFIKGDKMSGYSTDTIGVLKHNKKTDSGNGTKYNSTDTIGVLKPATILSFLLKNHSIPPIQLEY